MEIVRQSEKPVSIGALLLARMTHIPNKDACPRCLGTAMVCEESSSVPGRVVPCRCRYSTSRTFTVLKPFQVGLNLREGDTVEVYGWPWTHGRLTFVLCSTGSTFDGGWPSAFRKMLSDGFIRFTDTNG